MAPTLAPTPLPPPGAGLPPGRARGRGPALAALAAAVLAGHAWLADTVAGRAPAATRTAAAAPGAQPLQVRTLAVPPPGPLAAAGLAAAMPAGQRLPADAPATGPLTGTQVPARPLADTAGADGPVADLPVVPASARPSASLAPGPTAGADRVDEAGDADPPPRYATRLPPPADLVYRLHYNGQDGQAHLAWRHDGERYSLQLTGRSLGGAPLVTQASEGRLGPDGLVPDRFTDRRRSGRLLAANRATDGAITYSAHAGVHRAWPGTQDRLSWLAQLAGIVAASTTPDPGPLHLHVVDARGRAGAWRLHRQPDEPGATPWGEAMLQHWLREPARPEGLRVQAWLWPEAGPWPVRVRFTALRSGDVFELVLQAPPSAAGRLDSVPPGPR